jgi:hypothetical protein
VGWGWGSLVSRCILSHAALIAIFCGGVTHAVRCAPRHHMAALCASASPQHTERCIAEITAELAAHPQQRPHLPKLLAFMLRCAVNEHDWAVCAAHAAYSKWRDTGSGGMARPMRNGGGTTLRARCDVMTDALNAYYTCVRTGFITTFACEHGRGRVTHAPADMCGICWGVTGGSHMVVLAAAQRCMDTIVEQALCFYAAACVLPALRESHADHPWLQLARFGKRRCVSQCWYSSGTSGAAPQAVDAVEVATKDQDFAWGVTRDTSGTSFCVPIVCTEVKTNLDKTNMQEIMYTASNTRACVPCAHPMLVYEWMDMSENAVDTLSRRTPALEAMFWLRGDHRHHAHRDRSVTSQRKRKAEGSDGDIIPSGSGPPHQPQTVAVVCATDQWVGGAVPQATRRAAALMQESPIRTESMWSWVQCTTDAIRQEL